MGMVPARLVLRKASESVSARAIVRLSSSLSESAPRQPSTRLPGCGLKLVRPTNHPNALPRSEPPLATTVRTAYYARLSTAYAAWVGRVRTTLVVHTALLHIAYVRRRLLLDPWWACCWVVVLAGAG